MRAHRLETLASSLHDSMENAHSMGLVDLLQQFKRDLPPSKKGHTLDCLKPPRSISGLTKKEKNGKKKKKKKKKTDHSIQRIEGLTVLYPHRVSYRISVFFLDARADVRVYALRHSGGSSQSRSDSPHLQDIAKKDIAAER